LEEAMPREYRQGQRSSFPSRKTTIEIDETIEDDDDDVPPSSRRRGGDEDVTDIIGDVGATRRLETAPELCSGF